jgi:hypothetical protein
LANEQVEHGISLDQVLTRPSGRRSADRLDALLELGLEVGEEVVAGIKMHLLVAERTLHKNLLAQARLVDGGRDGANSLPESPAGSLSYGRLVMEGDTNDRS